MAAFETLAAELRDNEIGRNTSVQTPFGRRLICYADHAATGRALTVVEERMALVLPYYANTHTVASSTGRTMGELREASRHMVAVGVGANDDDVVLFTGSGATAAINKLVGILGLRISEPLERQYRFSQQIPKDQRPVVFVGPYEHHSNVLPWRESVAEVVEIGITPSGSIDMADLEAKLQAYAARPLKIGTFSAASNVTGQMTDVRAVARLLHANGAFACFDYAASGPYVPINMHPADPAESMDAVFISSHKFAGGPGASGVLVASKKLFRSRTPERPGGGTVDYVTSFGMVVVDYVPMSSEREEGGTPAILSDIRAGTVFELKGRIDPQQITAADTAAARAAVARLSAHPSIEVLGCLDVPRLGILSFNVKGLHHSLVATLLDQLFGIQARSGCACAGPYAHRLLGIDEKLAAQYRDLVTSGARGIKPGWARVSLPFYASAADQDFVLRAIEFIATNGQAFVPIYELDWATGAWRNLEHDVPRLPASNVGTSVLSDSQITAERTRYFAEAQSVVTTLQERWDRELPAWNSGAGDANLDATCWFGYVHARAAGAPERLRSTETSRTREGMACSSCGSVARSVICMNGQCEPAVHTEDPVDMKMAFMRDGGRLSPAAMASNPYGAVSRAGQTTAPGTTPAPMSTGMKVVIALGVAAVGYAAYGAYKKRNSLAGRVRRLGRRRLRRHRVTRARG